MAQTLAKLEDCIAVTPEHPIPAPGELVHLEYPAGNGPVGATVDTDAEGFATFTVFASAEEVEYSMQVARKAMIRSTGNDPENPESLGKARELMGAMAFADNVNLLAKQRLLALAMLRSRIFPFLAPSFMRGEPAHPGKDYTFQARIRLRPRIELTSYEPVELPFPEPLPVTEEEIDQRLASLMGNIQWSMVPEEARPALQNLRDKIRDQLALEHDAMNINRVAEACTVELAKRLAADPDTLFVELLRDEMANQTAASVEAQGIPWSQFIQQPDFNMDEFKATMTQNALASLRHGLALDAVAEREGIDLDLGDVLAAVGPMAMAQGHEREAAEAMLDNGQLAQLLEVARRAKTADWVARRAVNTASATEEPEAAEA